MKTIFWNVDTTYDFMRDDESFKGSLAVPGAREIEGNLEKITKFAKKNNFTVINTADWHTRDSKEFSNDPDYVNSFPPHCLQNTKGAEYVDATRPENPYIINWEDEMLNEEKVKSSRNIILYKDAFDIFEGNKHAQMVVDLINPDRVVVYGVATDYCVNYAVKGLIDRGKEVYVVLDAVKELPSADLVKVFDLWEGVHLTSTQKVLEGRI